MLLDNKGFDLWADHYNADVHLSDETNTYPFAGYKTILAAIYAEIMKKAPCKILDVGIGTGSLASKLYEVGNEVTGVDFSEEMLRISRDKMPNARFIIHDFVKGLPDELAGEKFDFIVLTYSLHHLTYEEQSQFLLSALDYLAEDGCMMVGDVAFETFEMMKKCREQNKNKWDEDEFYLIYSELLKCLGNDCKIEFQQITHCSGIVKITRN